LKWEVVVRVGVESEVNMCENGKWWSKVGRKWEVAVKVGTEFEVAMHENGK
jgi:hypothetical protein